MSIFTYTLATYPSTGDVAGLQTALFRSSCRVCGCAVEFMGRIGLELGLGLGFGSMSPVDNDIQLCVCVCGVDVGQHDAQVASDTRRGRRRRQRGP